jgi:hypothetical protein
MSILELDQQVIGGIDVKVSEDVLIVDLSDGRTLSVQIAWYPRLLHGSVEERNNWEWIGEGEGIHWPELDEDISVQGLLLGKRSGESQRSLQRWLGNRIQSSKQE